MATGTSTHVSSPAFHADDTEEVTEYRALSVTAIIALILGLASPLCFGHVLLFLIPLIGIAVAILALRQIAASDGALAGRAAALTGLALCIAFGVAPHVRALVLRTTRVHQAEAFGRRWLASVAAGETEHAFRLTVESNRRTPPLEPGMPEPKKSPYETFVDLPVVQALLAAGKDANIRFVGTTEYQAPKFNNVTIRQKYEISANAGSDAKPTEAILTLQRAKLATENRLRWLVYSLIDAHQPADSHSH